MDQTSEFLKCSCLLATKIKNYAEIFQALFVGFSISLNEQFSLCILKFLPNKDVVSSCCSFKFKTSFACQVPKQSLGVALVPAKCNYNTVQSVKCYFCYIRHSLSFCLTLPRDLDPCLPLLSLIIVNHFHPDSVL